MKTQTALSLDKFTLAYIEAALWSSTEYAYGECPCCGVPSILSHYPEPEFDQVPMCSREGCGVKEIDNPPPMDKHYSLRDLSESALETIVADCAKFQADNFRFWADAPQFDDKSAGHDFWLTRNGHGSGFWDRDESELPESCGSLLTEASKEFGECWLYVGDDGQLYIS